MPTKDKKKKAPEKVTVRLDFEGEVLERFAEYRFADRHESYKDAAMALIEKGMETWLAARDAQLSQSREGPDAPKK